MSSGYYISFDNVKVGEMQAEGVVAKVGSGKFAKDCDRGIRDVRDGKVISLSSCYTSAHKKNFFVYIKLMRIWIKIFQIFQRLGKREDHDAGLGTGLTIAKQIIEKHSGNMWVESRTGEGSSFYFTLPRV